MKLFDRLRIASAKDAYLLVMPLLIPFQTLPLVKKITGTILPLAPKGIPLFHIVNLAFILYLIVLLVNTRQRIRWPFLLPIWVILLGSLLGMLGSEVITLNLYTLAQDVYIYVWFAILCAVISREDDIGRLTYWWVIAAIVVVALDYQALSAVGRARSEFTFANPNRAAVYFLTSFFFLFSPAWKGRVLVRIAGAILVLAAALATSSLGILLSFGVGAIVLLVVYLYLHGRSVFVFYNRMLLLIAVGLVLWFSLGLVGVDITESLSERLPFTFGRAPRSLSTREAIWAAGLESFQRHPLGIGPQSFYGQIESGFGNTGRIELHSDFMAFLVERGVVGFLGLMMLLGSIALILVKLLRAAGRFRRPELWLWASALTGAVAAYIFYATSHEAFHHETLWIVLALVVAQSRMLSREMRTAQPHVMRRGLVTVQQPQTP